MRNTIDLTLCAYCNVRLTEGERQAGRCESCGRRLLKRQLPVAKAASKPAVKTSKIQVSTAQGGAEIREEAGYAAFGWAILALAFTLLGLAVLPVDVPVSCFFVCGFIAFLGSIPLFYYLAKYNKDVRVVGLAICLIFTIADLLP